MRKLFVLDTNVLIHDPTALFRFDEHDVFLPMVVLEELDNGKKGLSDTARNTRQANRFIEQLLSNRDIPSLTDGMPIEPSNVNLQAFNPSGRLFFQTEDMRHTLPETLPGTKADHTILATALAVRERFKDREVILVTKDINLRIKATVIGMTSEDYVSDHVLDDLATMPAGYHTLPEDFWDNHGRKMESWQEDGRTFYKLSGPLVNEWTANDCLSDASGTDFEAIVRRRDEEAAYIEYLKDYRKAKHHVWGINARNLEQNYALNVLLDPTIDFVSLVGGAGTGKTLLTLAAGLKQVLELELYREIIMTRVTVPVGEDIGFLPGTEEEKMTPWMGALMDNLEVLSESQKGFNTPNADQLMSSTIKIRSLNFMRGRTFLEKYIIIDEAQNLTPKQMQTLITRAGPGTKIVCLGNVAQIDTPYLTETSSGLTYAVGRMQNWEHSAHITLSRGERSRLADFASSVL